MRRQAVRDQVDLAVIHFPRNLLVKQQAVIYVVKLPQLGHRFFLGDACVIRGRRGVFVLCNRIGEGTESRPAYFGIRFQLVIVLEQGIAKRVFLPVHGERIKGDIRKLHRIVYGVRHIQGFAERGQRLLGFRGEHMCLLCDQVLQVNPASLRLLHSSLQYIIRSQQDLAVHKGRIPFQADHLIAYLLIQLPQSVVGVVRFHGQPGVVPEPGDGNMDRFHGGQAADDAFRGVQLSRVRIDNVFHRCLRFFQCFPHLLFIFKYQ